MSYVKDGELNEVRVGDQLCGEDTLVSLVRVKEILGVDSVMLEWLYPQLDRDQIFPLNQFSNSLWRKLDETDET